MAIQLVLQAGDALTINARKAVKNHRSAGR